MGWIAENGGFSYELQIPKRIQRDSLALLRSEFDLKSSGITTIMVLAREIVPNLLSYFFLDMKPNAELEFLQQHDLFNLEGRKQRRLSLC